MRIRRLAVLLAAAALLAACSGGAHQTASRSTSAAAGGTCSAAVTPTPLPDWARAGFQPADMAMPHVLGRSGAIVAVLWAPKDALVAPPLADRANKILWVSRLPTNPKSPLKIRATLTSTGQTVTREVAGGPGPSRINMPAAGCWVMDLSWSGHTDQLRLRYAAS
jgi:hypothetical protein